MMPITLQMAKEINLLFLSCSQLIAKVYYIWVDIWDDNLFSMDLVVESEQIVLL